MKETVAHLYACMIRFIIHAVRWYKQGKFAHAWAAVANPWALSFKNHFDDLAEQAQRVEELARSASRAELRDTHLELRETREVMQKYFEQMKSENSQLIQMALANKSLATQIQVDVSESKTMIANIQLGQILSMSFTENLPASGECLRYCQSMLKRRRHGIMPLLPDTSQLKTWSVHPRSSFLITESSSGQAAKDFLVNLVDLIRTSNHLILWALRFAGYWERNLTGLDILRMLVIQSLQINPTALTSKTHPLTMSHFREAVNEEDWLNILNRALVSVPYVYIVLDADLLSYATGRDRYQATKLIEAFPNRVTSTVVKLIVSTAGVDERYFSSNWDPDCWSKLRTDRGAVGHDSRIQRRRARHRIQNRFSNPRNRWGG
jgi:hypothetical protein